MRKFLFSLTVLLAGCGSDGVEDRTVYLTTPHPTEHRPEITGVALSPESVTYMQGNGSVTVTAEVSFRDDGLDIQSLWVQTRDGTATEFQVSANTATGTFTKDFVMSTEVVGAYWLDFWLVAEMGIESIHQIEWFDVAWIAQDSDWTSRLSGLPSALNDVTWDGDVFIAVGNDGSILTSADGIDWVASDSGTIADLNAVSAYGPDIFAVGDKIVLLSTDHGASWTIKDRPAETILKAVAINSSQVVVGGYRLGWSTEITMISEDRGDTWQAVDSWPDEDLFLEDLVYQDGMFVGTTNDSGLPGAWVTVSSDGKSWNEIAVSDEFPVMAWLPAIAHDGSQFILAGLPGAVFTSPDAMNWTQLHTPVWDVLYTGAARNGSKLVLAGGSLCGGLWIGCPQSGIPAGLSSTDGGLTWDIFNIDGDYFSSGLAWGNGRFVSVGQMPAYSGEGAIYTAE